MVMARKQIRQSRIRFSPASSVVFLALLGVLSTACGRQQHTSAEQHMASDSASDEASEASAQEDARRPHMPEMPSADTTPHPSTKPHQDHESKHGGTFFMALDEKHHLEGVLLSPGTFRVFLYDERSHPVSKQQVARADAKVTWGRQERASATDMKPSSDGLTLEAAAPANLTLPVELTLLIRFPGAAPDSRPELFTFPFAKFTAEHVAHKD